jgi:hypothetical protein
MPGIRSPQRHCNYLTLLRTYLTPTYLPTLPSAYRTVRTMVAKRGTCDAPHYLG